MIEVNVKKRLGDFCVDAVFQTSTSGIIALFGRSGSGKTTLVNMIAGLTKPDSGRIIVEGKTIFDSLNDIDIATNHRQLGYVFQEDRLFPHMSVKANLNYGVRRNNGKPTFGKIIELLNLSRLLDRNPNTLSGGEKQRVAIGRALLSEPRLLLMDEPLASLDSAHKYEILPFIEDLSNEINLPIIYVSHAMDEIIRLAQTMILISDGKIVAVDTVEELTSRLDLRPMTGRYEAGSVINVTMVEQDRKNGLSVLEFPGGKFFVPEVELPLGSKLRIRIRARDISIATSEPKCISINNVFSGRVTEIKEDALPFTDVLIDLGIPVWARISRASSSRLKLKSGKHVFAMVKAVSIDPYSLGRPGRKHMSV